MVYLETSLRRHALDEQSDPLDALFDQSSVQDQRKILAETILPYARIDSETLEIGFTDDGEQLVAREKLLVFFLARKALFLRNMISKEAASPSEIEKATGMAGGTIRPQLSRLVDDRLIRKEAGDGGYYVPNNRLKDANSVLIKRGAK